MVSNFGGPPCRRLPDFLQRALVSGKVIGEYYSRPVYQRIGYRDWVAGAGSEKIRLERLRQMIYELRGGKNYMNREYRRE